MNDENMMPAQSRDKSRMNAVDIALMRQINEDRNAIAMKTLYDTYRSRLVPFLLRMTKDQALIEEVYNDVMLTVWNKASQFKGDAKVSSWIFSIAYRSCLRVIQKQQFRQKVLDKLQFFTHQEEAQEDTQESGEFDLLNKAIAKLPPKQKIVIELSYYEGYSVQEIADIAQCPANTVKTRLHHARVKIRESIQAAKQSGNYDEK